MQLGIEVLFQWSNLQGPQELLSGENQFKVHHSLCEVRTILSMHLTFLSAVPNIFCLSVLL